MGIKTAKFLEEIGQIHFIFTSHKNPKTGKNENKVTVWLQI